MILKLIYFRIFGKGIRIFLCGFDSLRQDTHQFIFDTGAFQSKVEYSLSESLNLKTKFKRDNGTAQGIKREIEITSVDSVKIGESKFINIGAGKLKYDKNSYSPCVAKDGIIGANLIKLAHWKIDYQKKEML